MALPVASMFSGITNLVTKLMSVLMVVIILLYCSSVRQSEIDVCLQSYLPVLVDIKDGKVCICS